MCGHFSLMNAVSTSSLSTPRCLLTSARQQGRVAVGQSEMAALRIKKVQIQISRQILELPDALVVKSDAFRRQVVGTDDRGVPSGTATADVSALEDRDICDAMVARQVVRGRQTMAAGTDDDYIIRLLELLRRAEHPGLVVFFAEPEAEKAMGHEFNVWVKIALTGT